jgi:hypothetical protein
MPCQQAADPTMAVPRMITSNKQFIVMILAFTKSLKQNHEK